MKTAIAHLKSASEYGQGRHYKLDKLDKESAAAYEERTWRERAHWNEDGNMVIPQMAFKNCLSEAAKYLSIVIPGKGKATFTKHFEAGIAVMQPLVLPVTRESVSGIRLFVPADGRRGSGKRVEKIFPYVKQWEGDVEFTILDETITKEVFFEHLKEAGKFIGIGFFRPRNNGYWGRFSVESFDWK